MGEKVLLDTDIGSDVDDAVCLAYLLANPACDLVGVTTVTGEPGRRAALASALCREAGREIPIHAGSPLPLLVPQAQPLVPQEAALGRWSHRESFPEGTAVEFLRSVIRGNPGEITLLAIGPLTNVGLLFRVDPGIPALLKRLVLMGGSFSPQMQAKAPLEWNIKLDPHAAAIVYASRPPVHRSVGLDVTTRVTMAAEEVRRRFSRGLLRPVLDFAEVWFAQRPQITFHDPLAAVSIFDPSVCAFQRGAVSVETAGPGLPGRTSWTPAGDGPHEIAVEVDAPRFFREYFRVFDA